MATTTKTHTIPSLALLDMLKLDAATHYSVRL